MPTNLKRSPAPVYNFEYYPFQLKYQLQKGHEIARKNLIEAKNVSKRTYDQALNPAQFRKGDKVLLKNPTRKNKFSPIWIGPYKVQSVPTSVTTEIQVGKHSKKVHNNRLKLFHQ